MGRTDRHRLAPLSCAAILLLGALGCNFDSSAGRGTCKSGAESPGGWRCIDGAWVQPDATTPSDTANSDTIAPDLDAVDAVDLDAGPDARDTVSDTSRTDTEDARDVPRDTRADGVSDTELPDTGVDASDTRAPDTRTDDGGVRDTETADSSGPTDTAPPGDTADALDGGDTASDTDTSDGADGGPNCPGNPGCPCDYNGLSAGVCGTATIGPSGTCQQPSDFEFSESSCGNAKDNDCDGLSDANDPDCTDKLAGQKCKADDDCLSDVCAPNPGPGPPNKCAHRIAVTSKSTTGALQGIRGAHRMCKRLANRAKLNGTWLAVLSDSSDTAANYIDIFGAVYNLSPGGGTLVFTDEFQMWSSDPAQAPDAAVAYDETGTKRSVGVWTGTAADGSLAPSGDTCSGWSDGSNSVDGMVGRSDKTDTVDWIRDRSENCSRSYHLYCVDGQ